MTSQGTEHADASGRILRRRSSERVIGGVAGGLGDYLNVDPLLIRIGFVGLMIFGGAGLVLYIVAWLLIPAEGHERSIVEGILARLGITSRRIGWLILAVVAFIFLVNLAPRGVDLVTPGQETIYFDPAVLWAIVIIVAGFVLLRRREALPEVSAVAATDAAPDRPAVVAVTPRPRSPLAWYAYAAVLITIGLLALASQVGKIKVEPGQYFGAALAVMGIGLVVGAWWGRARVLILIAILLVPLAVAASFITAPLKGGLGDNYYAPANAAELRTEYRSMGGRTVLDLTGLSVTSSTFHIAASVAVGELRVILPSNASVQIDSRVGAGSAVVFDQRDDGTSLENRFVRQRAYGPTFILDLESGIGVVEVESQSQGGF
jgi:phage shock protein PspC (stress-responsive transcriptional regulator)